jgi:hypothetical protein
MSNDVVHLTPSESVIVNKLTGNGDVGIKVLFRLIRKRWPNEEEPNRRQQQIVGATISRANRKIRKRGLKIRPGVKRGAYRMTKII